MPVDVYSNQKMSQAQSGIGGAAAQPMRQGEVHAQREAILLGIGSAESLLAELESRLAPVIRDDERKQGGDPSKEAVLYTPLGAQLNDMAHRVSRLNDRLVRLISTLEV